MRPHRNADDLAIRGYTPWRVPAVDGPGGREARRSLSDHLTINLAHLCCFVRIAAG